jgi:hypothetical protein
MDSSTYGHLVNHGGYATGGIVSPSLTMVGTGDHETCFIPTGGTVSTLRAGYLLLMAGMPMVDLLAISHDADPDDGCAGVPAKV